MFEEGSENVTPNNNHAAVDSDTKSTHKAKGANMSISLDGLQSSIDPSKVFTRAYSNMKAHQAILSQVNGNNLLGMNGYNSAPPTATAHCPTCGKSVSDPLLLSGNGLHSDFLPLNSSPLVVPMGPLAAAAFESGMSAVEELRLLKAQVQDVARVCNAVARGDLSQKITVPVQGVVMVQLKDVINTMVRPPCTLPCRLLTHSGGQTRTICKGSHSCITGSRNRRVRCFTTLFLPSNFRPFWSIPRTRCSTKL